MEMPSWLRWLSVQNRALRKPTTCRTCGGRPIKKLKRRKPKSNKRTCATCRAAGATMTLARKRPHLTPPDAWGARSMTLSPRRIRN